VSSRFWIHLPAPVYDKERFPWQVATLDCLEMSLRFLGKKKFRPGTVDCFWTRSSRQTRFLLSVHTVIPVERARARMGILSFSLCHCRSMGAQLWRVRWDVMALLRITIPPPRSSPVASLKIIFTALFRVAEFSGVVSNYHASVEVLNSCSSKKSYYCFFGVAEFSRINYLSFGHFWPLWVRVRSSYEDFNWRYTVFPQINPCTLRNNPCTVKQGLLRSRTISSNWNFFQLAAHRLGFTNGDYVREQNNETLH